MNDVFTWPVGPATKMKPHAAPVFTYLMAATAGGASAGMLLSTAGQLVAAAGEGARTVLLAAVMLTVGVAILLQAAGLSKILPQRSRQVPRDWLAWPSRSATAGGWGWMIGAGFLTPLRFAAMYVLAALVIMAPSLELGCLVGAAYGLGRGSGLALTWSGDVLLGKRLAWETWFGQRRLHVPLALASGAVFGLIVSSGSYL